MTAPAPTRRPFLRAAMRLALALMLPLAVAACGDDEAASSSAPGTYPQPSYSHLTPIRLDAAQIEIDDSWSPRGASRRVEHLAPYPPRYTLKRMAEDRLVAAGRSGKAVFTIEDASILRGQRHYEASLAVRLEILDADGTLLGKADARVAKVRPITGDSSRAERDELYAFVRDLMAEMNTEFEFQVKQALKESVQQTSGTAPPPAPVDHQSLDSPAQPAPATEAPAAAATGSTALGAAGDDDDGPAVPLSIDPTISGTPAPPAPAAAPPAGAPASGAAPRAPTPLRPPG